MEKSVQKKITPTPDVSNDLETTICDKSKVAFKKEEPIKNYLGVKKITKKECITDARKYEKLKDWIANSLKKYNYAKHKGWYNECTAHMINLKKSKTKEECITDARKYKTLRDWIANSSSFYQYAKRKVWLDECSAHMVVLFERKKRTKEDCIADARKYKTNKEWRENSSEIYQYAKRKGWFDECSAHMVVLFERKKRTKEECITDARKYKTKKDWRVNSSDFHNYAKHKGWYNECTAHMVILFERKTRTKEECITDARKYKSFKEWREKSSAFYQCAYKKHWLDECTAHMVVRRKTYSLRQKYRRL